MPNETVSAKLDATLNPIRTIQTDLEGALHLMFQNQLPAPFIATIKRAVADLAEVWKTIDDTATALDPDRAKDQL